MRKTLNLEETKIFNRKLIGAYEGMLIKHTFHTNQFVRWKQGLKNKVVPEYNEPAIVWEMLPTPIFDIHKDHGFGSPYFNEPLDMVLAVMDENVFILLHYDSRRFEPIPMNNSSEQYPQI